MGKHEGCFKAYYRTDKAYYADAVMHIGGKKEAEIMVGFQHPEGGTTGEFAFVWTELGCQLKAFDDSWDALYNFPELLEYMASVDSERISPDDFEEKLKELGIKDVTKREFLS